MLTNNPTSSELKMINNYGYPCLTQDSLTLEVTRCPELILKAQKLRYRIFREELTEGNTALFSDVEDGVDVDEYDAYCDHVVVYKTLPDGKKDVIGTYRMLRRDKLGDMKHFYTENEFDMSPLLNNYNGSLVEVGRSCVLREYRKGPVIKLLWSGISMYLKHYNIDLLFGCASFFGTNEEEHALSLSYLHHFHMLEDQSICPIGQQDAFALIPKDQINERRAFCKLPPLVKGYIRLGAKIGNGVFVDYDMQTMDVCIIVDTKTIPVRQREYFTTD